MSNTITMEWRPIATAPDDKAILVWLDHGQRSVVAYWSQRKGCWFTEDGGDVIIQSPTHWMPLPFPPVVRKVWGIRFPGGDFMVCENEKDSYLRLDLFKQQFPKNAALWDACKIESEER